MFARKKEVTTLTGIGKLCVISFISAIAFSFITTIFAVYMDSFFHSTVTVGLVSAFFTFVAIISYFVFIPLIEKGNKEKIYITSLLIFIVSYILFAVNTSKIFLILIGMLFFIAGTFRITSFGIIIRDKSPTTKLSRNEGLVYTFANTAWIIGPLLAGIISAKYGMRSIFFIGAVILALVALIFKGSNIKDHKTKKKIDTNIYRNFIDFFKDKDRVLAYVLHAGVSFWWVLIYLYIPLLIVMEGFGTEWVGYFLFAVPIPLILLECKFSNAAGKVGFKRMFKIGYLIVFVLSLLCFFFISNFFIIFVLIVLASVGMAMLEPTTEAYFFDICKGKEDLRFYGPFNTAISFGGLFGKIIPALVLLIVPFEFTFIIFSVIMFILFLLSFKVKDVLEIRKRKK